MDVNDALAFIEKLVFEHTHKRMTDLQRAVFRGAWQGRNFQEIHKTDCPHVGLDYLMKHVGPKLWHLLSEVTGEEVTKSKLQGAVERAWQRQHETEVSTKLSIAPLSLKDEQLVPVANLKMLGRQDRLTSAFYVKHFPLEYSCFDVNDALAFVEKLVFEHTHKRMTDLQRAVFRGAWQGRNFQEIHKTDCPHVGLDYLMKHVGPKLWHLLSEVTGEEVTKSKLQGAVERTRQRQEAKEVVSDKVFIAPLSLENKQLMPMAPDNANGTRTARASIPFFFCLLYRESLL